MEIVVPLFGKITIKTSGTLTNTIKNLMKQKAFREGWMCDMAIFGILTVASWLPSIPAIIGFITGSVLWAYLVARVFTYHNLKDRVAFLAGILTAYIRLEFEKVFHIAACNPGARFTLTVAVTIYAGVMALLLICTLVSMRG